MNKVKALIDAASQKYKTGGSANDEVRDVALRCLDLLTGVPVRELGLCGGKNYVYLIDGAAMTRPILRDELLSAAEFRREWATLLASTDVTGRRYTKPPREANRVVYSAITAVSCAFDLWKPSSRKTPGTYFEILVGSLLQSILPGYDRLKHVILQGETENVATDIVFTAPGAKGGLVLPAKITTRERIVQAFAHQRILDSYFGDQHYKSVLVCVSEMQRDEERGANEICVPGAIRLYQKHLAPMAAIYYLDPPTRYLQPDVTSVVPVKTLGELLTHDLSALL